MHSPHRLMLVFFALNASLMAQSDPVPFVNQSLVPGAVLVAGLTKDDGRPEARKEYL